MNQALTEPFFGEQNEFRQAIAVPRIRPATVADCRIPKEIACCSVQYLCLLSRKNGTLTTFFGKYLRHSELPQLLE
ncbi:MAG: hypothetical protein LH647_19575 [Leptolyngbyaceae cyanobacterium CAN_BIN12]|nr:hypothetical protein [Leptolyngbyaceae cyanobacterium CAN_BIN12]